MPSGCWRAIRRVALRLAGPCATVETSIRVAHTACLQCDANLSEIREGSAMSFRLTFICFRLDSMFRSAAACAAVISGLSCLPAAPVRAATLPAAIPLADCSVDSTRVMDPSNCKLGDSFASVTLLPFVSLVAHASSPPIDVNGNHGAGTSASVTYSFQVIGGNPGDIVPILIATNLSSLGTDPTHGSGFAELSVHTGAAGDSFVVVCSNATCGTTSRTFSGTLSTRARSGDVGDTLTLLASTSTGDSLNSESASASADPSIFVDPSSPSASQYSIVLSAGVGNGIASVPEPRSSVLIALGGLILWRCRRMGVQRATDE